MGILEEVIQMKNQGIGDERIVNTFRERGISPREINDALDQAQIKNAVSDTQFAEQNPPAPEQEYPGNYVPQTQEMLGQEEYAPQSQEYSPQENYENYSASTGINSDTIIEISEQVFSEKIQKIQKQLENINEFKILTQTKIDNNLERLKRIESVIDKLQIAILEKIGSYGKNLETIKKEMSMMQDSFGKVVNQAIRGANITPDSAKKISKKK